MAIPQFEGILASIGPMIKPAKDVSGCSVWHGRLHLCSATATAQECQFFTNAETGDMAASRQKRVKSRLYVVVIGCERIAEVQLIHDCERDAVRKRPRLVSADRIEFQACIE